MNHLRISLVALGSLLGVLAMSPDFIHAAVEPEPLHMGTVLTPETVLPNTSQNIELSIKNNGIAGNVLVDIEIYKNGTRVAQRFFDQQFFGAGETRTFNHNWKPTQEGEYKISVGLFRPNWAGLYQWTDRAALSRVSSAGESGLPIYYSGWKNGWENWSWDTTVTAPAGGKLTAEFHSPWAGLFAHTAGMSTIGRRHLIFSIHGEGATSQELQLLAYNDEGNPRAPVLLSSYVPGGISGTQWKEVRIPLSDLGASWKTITGFVIQGSNGSVQAPFSINNMSVQ